MLSIACSLKADRAAPAHLLRRHHHERWDGSGYPDQLAREEITPLVQVVGLADAFDALIYPRLYKPPIQKTGQRHDYIQGLRDI